MQIRHILSKFDDFVSNIEVGESVLDLIIASGEVVPKESDYWDFKAQLPDPGDIVSMARFVRSVAAFYNTFGGYLIYGIQETETDLRWQVAGIGKVKVPVKEMRGALKKYFRETIDITIRELNHNQNRVALIHVPKRPPKEDPIAVVKTGPNKGKGSPIFRERETLFRNKDECLIALTAHDFAFLGGERNNASLLTDVPPKFKALQNLPNRSVICPEFVGREKILTKLWEWLYSGVYETIALAGAGGRGKTSIAYQFASAVVENYEGFDMVWWLSAKEKQYRGLQDNYESLPYQYMAHTQFSTCKELLYQLAELLIPDFDGDDSDRNLMTTLRKELGDSRILLIIDDVDSCDPEEQEMVLDAVTNIANGKSKILVTTRNITWSVYRRIDVPGFDKEEFNELFRTIERRAGITLDIHATTVDEYRDATGGSPLFLESIFRLIMRGEDPNTALSSWRDHEGEDVRDAALSREVNQLSDKGKEVLLAASCLGNCSLVEIGQICEIKGEGTINSRINELKALFLFDSPRYIEAEKRFEVSEPIANFIISKGRDIIPRYEDIVEEANSRRSSERGKESGALALSQCMALLKEGRTSDALGTVNALLKRAEYRKDGDLLLLKGEILVRSGGESKKRTHQIRAGVRCLEEAFRSGQRNRKLFDLMYLAHYSLREWKEAIAVCKNAIDVESLSDVHGAWRYKQAKAAVRLGEDSSRAREVGKVLEDAAESLTVAITSSTDGEYSAALETLHDIVLRETIHHLTRAEAALRAIDRGDYRQTVFDQIVSAVKERAHDISRNRFMGKGSSREDVEDLLGFLKRFEERRQWQERGNLGQLELFEKINREIQDIITHSSS